MREFIDFSLFVLGKIVSVLFDFDLGSYSFGAFLVAALVVSVFIGSLVIKFRDSGNISSAYRPPRVRSIKRTSRRKGG